MVQFLGVRSKGPVILKWEPIEQVFLAHWIEIFFDRDFHLNLAFTTDLISLSQRMRMLSAQITFNLNADRLSETNTLIQAGQKKKAIKGLNKRNRYFGEHPTLALKGREKRLLKSRNINLATDLVPDIILKLATLVSD